jgi:Methylase involved in ubiquinone/menaquinone biosynthesis
MTVNPSCGDNRIAGEQGDAGARQPHAVLDLPSRRLKGLKIERLLDLASRPQPMRMLEIGTGSGGIAHYFGTHPQLHCEVDAVDVHDNRLVTEGYRYQQVHGTQLPFDDASFDVVLSNHVIEHVGDEQAQRAHLAEIYRVMHPRGVGYLAVPNRWMLVEPHYRLAFLSWLPRSLRTPYLRMMGRGHCYDCEPLSLPRLDALLANAGFISRHLEIEAMQTMLAIEDVHSGAVRLVQRLPDRAIGLCRRMIPTLICRIERRS